ncbi:MAG: hypothetical protein COT45_05105 [bacterium (Candidatus Stahlbacteria) CG08_land_8_20_14_0_20_40_26]|nr:MAG: hypothetical protein COT45_05105 [bacterium (Candidatus Stahlbacteria) CG08_land_8_20_14_0_20_40_26]
MQKLNSSLPAAGRFSISPSSPFLLIDFSPETNYNIKRRKCQGKMTFTTKAQRRERPLCFPHVAGQAFGYKDMFCNRKVIPTTG